MIVQIQKEEEDQKKFKITKENFGYGTPKKDKTKD